MRRPGQRALSLVALVACTLPIAEAFATARLVPRARLSSHRSASTSMQLLGTDDPIPQRSDDPPLLPAAAVLGIGTACMGTAYAKALRFTVSSVWTRLPAALALPDPTLFVPAACTLGGAVVGLLAVNLPTTGMPDFIGKQRSTMDSLPGIRPYLAPVLLLSLLTSTFGFSVGPEAPMVVAGALVGSAFGKRLYGDNNHAMARTMAYAGAAGALTTFIGMPLAGAIFVLEIPRASSGLAAGAHEALTPAIVASCASMLVAKAVFAPAKAIGGHFAYAAVGGALTGRTLAAISLSAGACGALIARTFVALVATYKRPMWPQAPPAETCEVERRWACGPKTRHVLVKTAVGLSVGLIGLLFPQTLFWGEGSLQHVIDGQHTALSNVWPGLSPALTARAVCDVSAPFTGAPAALKVGVAKLVAIALACAGGFPGGIIFPLFFAAAALAHTASALVPSALMPVWVMSLMASTQASVTRTPLATVFMLGLSASASAQVSTMLPPVIIAAYVGVWVSRAISEATFFPYNNGVDD